MFLKVLKPFNFYNTLIASSATNSKNNNILQTKVITVLIT